MHCIFSLAPNTSSASSSAAMYSCSSLRCSVSAQQGERRSTDTTADSPFSFILSKN